MKRPITLFPQTPNGSSEHCDWSISGLLTFRLSDVDDPFDGTERHERYVSIWFTWAESHRAGAVRWTLAVEGLHDNKVIQWAISEWSQASSYLLAPCVVVGTSMRETNLRSFLADLHGVCKEEQHKMVPAAGELFGQLHHFTARYERTMRRYQVRL